MANKLSKNGKKGIVGAIATALAWALLKAIERQFGDMPAEQEAAFVGAVVFVATGAFDAWKHRKG